MPVPKIAVVKTNPSAVLNDYEKLMHLAEYEKVLNNDIETLLKLNLSWTLYFPSCSTQPWQLEGVIKTMQNDGYRKIIAVENETVVTKPRKGAELNKWDNVMARHEIPFQPLHEVEWVKYRAK